MENVNNFRVQEKRYKCPGDLVPDLSEVLDTRDPNSYGYNNLQAVRPDVFTYSKVPGLIILKDCVSPDLQKYLLKEIMFEQLQDSKNKTNLSPFYKLPLETDSIWRRYHDGRECDLIEGIPPTKPATVERLIQKKLRWVTLGEQYDWTEKVYPDPALSPPFPTRLASFVEDLVQSYTDYPKWKAEAAIVNFYSPSDTLSAHVDRSEEDLTLPLISLSIGLDCIYLIGGSSRSEVPMALRLHSGDVVIMTGPSRQAFHAVPKILASTIPSYLLTESDQWNRWIQTKRVNFNIRQVRNS
ncbi:alkB protein [Schizosaccharomyces octosporus yFS286]|uniref:AlkB protein n=1 Tax=Schizosaccharomyces octosporus (strain yFS286) TaxID=483514 RepID=S9PPI3_SCHOY|nr:alkB protein [Schizosaccharomyces octosporus yFS286]EPX71121.1 alkB protein [Schizosaccharomyces octosporus yFS286]